MPMCVTELPFVPKTPISCPSLHKIKYYTPWWGPISLQHIYTSPYIMYCKWQKCVTLVTLALLNEYLSCLNVSVYIFKQNVPCMAMWYFSIITDPKCNSVKSMVRCCFNIHCQVALLNKWLATYSIYVQKFFTAHFMTHISWYQATNCHSSKITVENDTNVQLVAKNKFL